jgi:hypothetical protein
MRPIGWCVPFSRCLHNVARDSKKGLDNYVECFLTSAGELVCSPEHRVVAKDVVDLVNTMRRR